MMQALHRKSYPMKRKGTRWLTLCLLIMLTLLSACRGVERSTRWDEVQEQTAGERTTSAEALPGGEFNRYFPNTDGEYEVVYTQEKSGFAEAVLRRSGEDVATLAVSDIVNNPTALDKYQNSSNEIAGYPAAAVGSNGTAILVADRFQVQVRSTVDDFTADDRAEWLSAFDLSGLESLS